MNPAFRIHHLHFKKLLVLAAFLFFTTPVPGQNEAHDVGKIYTQAGVAEQPEYPGGTAEMMKFVMKNMDLPELPKDQPPAASMRARFVVNEDGSVSDAEITKSSGNTGVDKALLDVIRKMPAWKPAKQYNKAVKCYYNLPIRCILYK